MRDLIDSKAVSAMVGQLAGVARDLENGARIDLIRALEDLKSACAGAQAKVTADLDAERRRERAEAGVPKARQGRGIAAEVALARRDSHHSGDRHVGFARALVHEMPHTLQLLESGALNEWRATLLVRETACLSVEDRAWVDRELCADPAALDGLGDRAVAAAARRLAAQRDVHALVERARRALSERRVTTRPAPDTMAYVTALLGVREAVTVQATLGRDADAMLAAGDARIRSQIMADLLVERVTGLSVATRIPTTVNLVISDEALLAGGTEPAHVEGYGPIPAMVAREWIAESREGRTDGDLDPTDAELELRRLYANPRTGALTATESASRFFPPTLSRMVDVRDQTCRTPWCDAPIRHRDHIEAHENGGPTTLENGAGVCEACNHAKQAHGWNAQPDSREPGELHCYTLITPTGHRYRSVAPRLPVPAPNPVRA